MEEPQPGGAPVGYKDRKDGGGAAEDRAMQTDTAQGQAEEDELNHGGQYLIASVEATDEPGVVILSW